MRSRQLRELSTFAKAVRTIAVCYDGLVVPGSLLLIEGNTVIRLRFMRHRLLTRQSLQVGRFTAELQQERSKVTPSVMHFLDFPALAPLRSDHFNDL